MLKGPLTGLLEPPPSRYSRREGRFFWNPPGRRTLAAVDPWDPSLPVRSGGGGVGDPRISSCT